MELFNVSIILAITDNRIIIIAMGKLTLQISDDLKRRLQEFCKQRNISWAGATNSFDQVWDATLGRRRCAADH